MVQINEDMNNVKSMAFVIAIIIICAISMFGLCEISSTMVWILIGVNIAIFGLIILTPYLTKNIDNKCFSECVTKSLEKKCAESKKTEDKKPAENINSAVKVK